MKPLCVEALGDLHVKSKKTVGKKKFHVQISWTQFQSAAI